MGQKEKESRLEREMTEGGRARILKKKELGKITAGEM